MSPLLKPCLTRGCQNLTRGSRCPDCHNALRRAKRADPTLTGNMARRDPPDRVRRRVLHRDGYRCQDCSTGLGLQLHHLNGDANDNELENLETLCSACHRKRHEQTDPHSPFKGNLGRFRASSPPTAGDA